jgi:excisionase family DNA binding protein
MATSTKNGQDWRPTREVAAHLGLHERTLRDWARLRGAPHLRCGRVLRFQTVRIEAWLREQESNRREVTRAA